MKSTAHPLGARGVLPPIIRPPKLLYAAANRLNKKKRKTQQNPGRTKQ